MNSKRILTAVGLGALTVALVAVPGSSARKQTSSHSQSASGPQPRISQDSHPLPLVESDLNDLQDVEDDGQMVVISGHGWLGAAVSEVTPDKVKEFKLPAERGVVLGKIVPDSPAAKAGLKENDVVTELNGQRVEGTEQFRRLIREIPSGRHAQITVWREGRAQTLSVTVGKAEPHINSAVVSPGTFAFNMPDLSHLNEMMEVNPWLGGQPRLGIDAEDLEGDFGNYFGAPDGVGVLIRGVFPDSPAAKAGLKAGDVITAVNGDRVRSVADLREKLAEKHSENTVKLGVLRNKAPLTLSVQIPPPAEKQERHHSVRTNI
jgi:serine protease Do